MPEQIDERVGEAAQPAQVERQHVLRLLVERVLGDQVGELLGRAAAPFMQWLLSRGLRRVPTVQARAPRPRAPRPPARSAAGPRPRATRARSVVELMSIRGMSKTSARDPPDRARASASSMSSRRLPRALRDRHPCQAKHLSRLAPRRQALGHVGADDERQLVSRIALMQLPQRIHRVGRPAALDLEVAHPEPLVARHRRPAQREPHLRARARPPPPCAADVAAGTSSTRSSPSCSSASCAQIRCPRCGGLNVPPSSPTRAIAAAHRIAAHQRRPMCARGRRRRPRT